MNAIQLTAILASHPTTRPYFGGVKASDEIWNKPTKPLIIVNNQASDQPGQHWLALYLDKDTPEFFDSLGHPPSYYTNTDIEDFLICNGPQYMHNNGRVQKRGTSSCGLFCLYYAFNKCSGFTLDTIMKSFSTNLEINEIIVNNFFECVNIECK